MKFIHTVSKHQYEVSDEQAAIAAQAMLSDGVFHLKDQGAVIKGSAIMEISDKGTGDTWLCAAGHTHPKEDTFCSIPPKVVALPSRTTTRTPEEEEEEHKRQRSEMEKIRNELAEKLRWKK